MANLSSLNHLILPHASGAPLPAVYTAIRAAAAEFLRRTRLWPQRITMAVTPAVIHMPAPVNGGIMFEIARGADGCGRVWFDGNRLRPVEFATLTPQDLDVTNVGQPRLYSQPAEQTVSLVPRGTGELMLDVYCTLPVTGPAMDGFMPDNLAGEHAQTIAAGALGRLMVIPKRDWTNPQLAGVHLALFNADCDRLFARHIQGQQKTPLRTKPSFM